MFKLIVWLLLAVFAVPVIVAAFQASRKWGCRNPEEERQQVDKLTK